MRKTTISKRRWLFLPIQTKARELFGKTLLAYIAAEKGWGVIIGQKEKVRGIQQELPRGTFIEESISQVNFSNIKIEKSLGNRVSAWCEEGLIYHNREYYRQMRIYTKSFDSLDYFFAWGQNHADDIRAILGNEDKIILAGNPRFDLLRPELRDVFAQQAEQYKKRFGNIILINTNFGTVNTNIPSYNNIEWCRSIGTIKTKVDEERIRQRDDFRRKIFSCFLKLLPSLSGKFQNHTIIIRSHPSENDKTWIDAAKYLPNIKVVYEGTATEWMMAADVIIQNNCTTGVEGFLLNRPVISYRPIQDNIFDHKLINEITVQAKNENEIVDLIKIVIDKKCLLSEEERNDRLKYAQQYISRMDGKLACDTIMETLEKLDLPLEGWVLPIKKKSMGLKSYLKNVMEKIAGEESAELSVREKYTLKKFPGVSHKEMQGLIDKLNKITGKFPDIVVIQLKKDVFCVYKSTEIV